MVASTDAITIGLPQAIKAAGLSNVKIVGQGATPTNIQYLHSGQQAADVAFPYYEVMYSMFNAAIQAKAGMPVAASVAPPKWLLIPANAPQTTATVFPVVDGLPVPVRGPMGQVRLRRRQSPRGQAPGTGSFRALGVGGNRH